MGGQLKAVAPDRLHQPLDRGLPKARDRDAAEKVVPEPRVRHRPIVQTVRAAHEKVDRWASVLPRSPGQVACQHVGDRVVELAGAVADAQEVRLDLIGNAKGQDLAVT